MVDRRSSKEFVAAPRLQGIFIDDVNLVMNLTGGTNQLTPIDTPGCQ